jgi:O-antigen/teichoic acid export membrane protein
LIKFKSIRNAFGWQSLSQSIQAIINISYLMIMGRLLTKEAFGIFALASVVIAYINMFTEFGLGAALIQKKEISKEEIGFTFYANLIVGVVLFLSLLVLAPFITNFYNDKFSIIFLLVLGSQLIIKSLSIVSRSLLVRDLDFKKIFLAQGVGYFIGCIVVGIPMAYLGFEEWALSAALIVTAFYSSIVLYYYRPHSLVVPKNFKKFRGIVSYGIQLTKVRLTNQTAHQVDKLMIGKFFSTEILGIYERFQKIIMLPETYIGRLSDNIVFSGLSRIKEDKEQLSRHFTNFLFIMVFLITPISILVYFYAQEVISILLGAKWASDYQMLEWMSILIFVQTFSRYADTLVRATGAFASSFKNKLLYLIVSVSLILYASTISIYYVIAMVIISKIFHSVIMIVLCKSILDIQWKKFLLPFKPILFISVLVTIVIIAVQLVLPNGILSLIISSVMICTLLGLIFLKSPRLIVNEQQENIFNQLLKRK